MNKAITTAICALMIILGLVLAIFYYSFWQGNSGDVGYFVFAFTLFCGIAVCDFLSLFLPKECEE